MNRFDRRGLDRRHAFSIAEIVISMAIIILLSILGFTACYVALGSQRNASRNLEILSAMDGASSAFEAACDAYAPSGEAGEKLNFLNEFHRRLAFALDSYAPNVRGLDEAAGYGVGQDWQISLANRTRTEYVVVEENGVERLGFTTAPSRAEDTSSFIRITTNRSNCAPRSTSLRNLRIRCI